MDAVKVESCSRIVPLIVIRFALLWSAISLAFAPAVSRAEEPLASHGKLIERVNPSVVTLRVEGRDGEQRGVGTGFVIDSEGLIATNFHVIGEGRDFSVETANGKTLDVIAVEASDVNADLAIIRVESAPGIALTALKLAASETTEQGMRVLAFGNPLGLQNSVVEGIISARRDVDGQDLLQLAMPIEPGNSGGPLVDLQGRVHGIINMKSAIDDNLGFAIPIERLEALTAQPNPVAMARWVTLGKINEQDWKPIMGARWRRRGTRIVAQGTGDGFGGRSLLLSQADVPEPPFELAVSVKLDDESGAAGLAFFSDGDDKHYGFYPSAGNLRLTCFRGPSVFSWQVLEEVESEDYLPGQWNHLKVRVEKNTIKCFVNGQLVIESTDRQLRSGKAGLAKFRDTQPEFRGFRIGSKLNNPELSEAAQAILAELKTPTQNLQSIGDDEIQQLGQSNELASRELVRQALELEQQAKGLRKLASDVRLAGTLDRLRKWKQSPTDARLLTGALLIAALDDPDVDVETYRRRVDEMVAEISESVDAKASPPEIRQALHRYLFDQNGFHGSRSEYYHRANSHISRVIDDREGLPITLSILYIELGRRLGLTIDGIGLPGHFVVQQAWGENETQWIDVFERGKLLSDSDAESLVMLHAGRLMRPSDKEPQSDEEILTRVLNNLIGVAAREQDGEVMLRYCEAMVAIAPESTEFRLMRVQLRGMTGRIGLAIEDLDALMETELSAQERAGATRLRRALED